MKNSILYIIIGLICTSCAGISKTSPQDSEKLCTESNGSWTAFKGLYPNNYPNLSKDDVSRFICRIKTNEENVICSDDSHCRGLCVADEDAVAGEEAVGLCAKYMWPSYDERNRLILKGRVGYPDFSLKMTESKKAMIAELIINRDKWSSQNIQNYRFVSKNENCACFYGPYYGPIEVIVKNNKIVKAIYLGEERDGFKAGDSLKIKTHLKQTVDDFFSYAETTIRRSTSNAYLKIEYDKEFGFPILIDYDRPDWADDQSKLVIFDFSLILPNKQHNSDSGAIAPTQAR